MTIEQMRQKIMGCYKGMKWHDRCLHMPSNQVYAIYKSLEAKNFNVGVTEEKVEDAPKKDANHQMDMFEYSMLQKMVEEKYPYDFHMDDSGTCYGFIGKDQMFFVSEEEYKEYLNDCRNEYMVTI